MDTAREVAERLTAAVLAGDVEAIGACYAEDAVAVTPEGTFRGREQIAEYWAAFTEAFSEIGVEILARHDAGETAVDEWILTGVHTGDLDTPAGTIAATGRRFHVRGADVGTIRDGLVAEHRAYYDQAELLGQIGVGAVPA